MLVEGRKEIWPNLNTDEILEALGHFLAFNV
jgi:hypothetical protein